jgi:hypothetical protein
LENDVITIYGVMQEEPVKIVSLDLVSIVPLDAGYHLSADAKVLCIRNYRQYIFVDAQSGNEMWVYDNNIVNPVFGDHIIWIDFINDYQMIGVHRKIKGKTIFKLDANYGSAN